MLKGTTTLSAQRNLKRFIELYDSGLTPAQIGRELNMDQSTIAKKLKTHHPSYRRSTKVLPALERFEMKVFPEPNTGCWLWAGTPSQYIRYGSISVDGKEIGAHIFSYTHYKGDIPSGMEVCHTCDIGFCVNPDHLFLGTHKQNMEDMSKKDRQRGPIKVTDQQVIEIRKLAKSGVLFSNIAKRYNLDRSYVGRIVRNIYRKKVKRA